MRNSVRKTGPAFIPAASLLLPQALSAAAPADVPVAGGLYGLSVIRRVKVEK